MWKIFSISDNCDTFTINHAINEIDFVCNLYNCDYENCPTAKSDDVTLFNANGRGQRNPAQEIIMMNNHEDSPQITENRSNETESTEVETFEQEKADDREQNKSRVRRAAGNNNNNNHHNNGNNGNNNNNNNDDGK